MFWEVKVYLLVVAIFLLKYVRVSSAIGRPVLVSPASLDHTLLFSAFGSRKSFSLGLAFPTALSLIFCCMETHKRQKRSCYPDIPSTARFPVKHDFFFLFFSSFPCLEIPHVPLELHKRLSLTSTLLPGRSIRCPLL